jgi:hypothetical protein
MALWGEILPQKERKLDKIKTSILSFLFSLLNNVFQVSSLAFLD